MNLGSQGTVIFTDDMILIISDLFSRIVPCFVGAEVQMKQDWLFVDNY